MATATGLVDGPIIDATLTAPSVAALMRSATDERLTRPSIAVRNVAKDTPATRTSRADSPRPRLLNHRDNFILKVVHAACWARKREVGAGARAALMVVSMDRPKTAQKIHDLRLSKGLTMEELARRVGVSKETVRLWEGGRPIRGANLERLAQELGAAPSTLSEAEEASATKPELDGKDRYVSRRDFLTTYGSQLSSLEAGYLRSLRYVGDPGPKHWAEELMRYREVNRAILAAFRTTLQDKVARLPAGSIGAGERSAEELPPNLRSVVEKMKTKARLEAQAKSSGDATKRPSPSAVRSGRKPIPRQGKKKN